MVIFQVVVDDVFNSLDVDLRRVMLQLEATTVPHLIDALKF